MPQFDIRLFDASKGRLVLVPEGSVIEIRTQVPMGVEFEDMPLQAARPLVIWHLLERVLEHAGLGGRFIVKPFGSSEACIFESFGAGRADKHGACENDGEHEDLDEAAWSPIELLLPGFDEAEPHRNHTLTAPIRRRLQATGEKESRCLEAAGKAKQVNSRITAAELEAQLAASAHSVREAARHVGYESVLLHLLSVHYADQLGRPERGLPEGYIRATVISETVRTLDRGQPSPSEMNAYLNRFLDALAHNLDTKAAITILFQWLYDAQRRKEPVGDSHLREMLTLLGIEELLNAPSML